MDHRIVGRYTNHYGQTTVVCACDWRGDDDRQHEDHLLDAAKIEADRLARAERVDAAKKALRGR